MSEPTRHPQTYERGDYSGEHWLLAEVDFGINDDGEPQRFCITTEYVHASDFEPGDPEADVRLWSSAPHLIHALQRLLARHVDLVNSGDCGFWDPEGEAEVQASRAAIARALGLSEVQP